MYIYIYDPSIGLIRKNKEHLILVDALEHVLSFHVSTYWEEADALKPAKPVSLYIYIFIYILYIYIYLSR